MTVWNRHLRKLLQNVDIPIAFSVDFGTATNKNTWCPFHESPDKSQSKSCSVSIDGVFHCNGCGETGDVFDFVAKRENITRDAAIKKCQNAYGKREADAPAPRVTHGITHKRQLTTDLMYKCISNLKLRTDFRKYLQIERGLTDATIDEYQIGCDEYRITIPVFDDDSSHTLVNLRRYNPRSKPKMISFGEGYGKLRLFPMQFFDKTANTVYLVEGEWDCILLRQLGFNAITVTGGVGSWDHSFDEYFRGKTVYIIYDVHDKEDDLGQQVARNRAAILSAVDAKVYIVELDLPTAYVGGDITDYFIKERRTVEQFNSLVAQAPLFSITAMDTVDEPEPAKLAESKAQLVSLSAASHSRYFYKKIQMRCLVAGKGSAPYMPPRTIRIEVLEKDGTKEIIEHTFNPWEGAVLSLIQCSTTRLHQFLRGWFSIPRDALTKVTIINTFNIEEIFLIPAIDLHQDQGPYVIRQCYYVGHGIQSNRVYDFIGYTLPDPSDQAATHILTTAIPAETDIDTFKLVEGEKEVLAQTFQTDDIATKLSHISSQFADHVTKIYGREDLHIAVDLVFHSPCIFEFDNTLLKRGWLDVLILGDTRTGKGFVTENLCRHYRTGEVVSGENVTLAGLIGGVQHLGDKWTLVWGKIPLADRRLIVIDEAGSLSYSDISKLSRIRSEGVAEITKIVAEKTTARTRLIWLANPRPKSLETSRTLADYNYGIDSVSELVGAAEDIARFDYVLNVGHNDVPSSEINCTHTPSGELQYTSELCHKLVMWVWSRRSDQIVFDKGVEQFTMVKAQELAGQFTSKIPLIQNEDVRFKLARIACAVAGRVFSTEDGETLIVREEHVQYAYDFLRTIYGKPICGYAQMSSVERDRQTLANTDIIYNVLTNAGENFDSLIDGLLEHRMITLRDLRDYAALDQYQAQAIISELVRLRAIIKENSYYVKKPAFKMYLRKVKHERELELERNNT
ncbi:MAG: CHC2 zinc finger domain-containing protein [Dehalococcoidia bacterium]|nr:CHC2 zinc finger domain-containing protein [Dehalococcoidia bacterium]